jgi:hypothetical protein
MHDRKSKSEVDSYGFARQLQSDGQYELAIRAYKASRAPDSFQCLIDISKCYTKLNNFESALSYLKQAECQCETRDQKISLYNHLQKNYDYLYRKTRDNKYLSASKETLDKQPDKTNGYYKFYLASYYFNIDQIESSENILNALITEKADDNNLMRMVSLLHIKIKKEQNHNKLTKEEAEKQLQSYSKLPGVTAGELLQIAYDYPELIDLKKISLLPSNNIEGFLKEAGLYNTLNIMPEKEEKIYQYVIMRSPQEWKARVMYAYFLSKNHCYEEAINILNPLINAAKGPSTYDLIKAYRILACNYWEIGDNVNTKKSTLAGLAIVPDDASLLSMLGKLEQEHHNHSLRSTKHFEDARKADENRFNKNHPLPTTETSKVSYEKNNHQNNIIPASSSTTRLTQNLLNPVQVKPNKSTIKKKTNKKEIELAPVSYDGIIETCTSLKKKDSEVIPSVEKEKPTKRVKNQTPVLLEIPAILANNNMTQTTTDIVTVSENTMTSVKNSPENVTALATPVFNQQQPTYSNCNRLVFFVATAATVATITATVALSLNS